MIAAIDERDVNRLARKRPRHRQAAEAATDDHHASFEHVAWSRRPACPVTQKSSISIGKAASAQAFWGRRCRTRMASISVGEGKSGRRALDHVLPLVPFIDFMVCLIAFLIVTAV